MGIAGSNNDGKPKNDENSDNESIVVIGDEEIVNDDDSRPTPRQYASGENQFKESIVIIGDEEIVNINDVTEQNDSTVGSSRTQTRSDDDEIPPSIIVPPPVEPSTINDGGEDGRRQDPASDKAKSNDEPTIRKIFVPVVILDSLERRENMSMYGLDGRFWASDLTDDHDRIKDIAGGISYKPNAIVDRNFLEPQLQTMLNTFPHKVRCAKFPSHFDESLRIRPAGLTGVFTIASRSEIQQGILCRIHVPTPAELLAENAMASSHGAIRRLPQAHAGDLSEVMVENDLFGEGEKDEDSTEASVGDATVQIMEDYDFSRENKTPPVMTVGDTTPKITNKSEHTILIKRIARKIESMLDARAIDSRVNESPAESNQLGETCARILEQQGIAPRPQQPQLPYDSEINHERFSDLEALLDNLDINHARHVADPARIPRFTELSDFLTVRQHLAEMHKVPDGMEEAIRNVHRPLDKYIAKKTKLHHDLSLYSQAFNSLKQELGYTGAEPTDVSFGGSTEDPPPPVVPTMPGPPFDTHPNPDSMMSRDHHNRMMQNYQAALNSYVTAMAVWSPKLMLYVEMKEKLLKEYQAVILQLLRQKFIKMGFNVS